MQAKQQLRRLGTTALLRFFAAVGTFRAALLNGAARLAVLAALHAFVAAAELGVFLAACSLVFAVSELGITAGGRGLGCNLVHFAARLGLGGVLRKNAILGGRTAAQLGVFAASRAFDAALLDSGTAALVLGTALHALLAAAEFSIGLTTGTLGLATGELLGATVLGDIAGLDGTQKQAEDHERSGK